MLLLLIAHPAARGDEPTKPTASATESNPAQPAPGHSIHGESFNDGPRQEAHLMPGMGKAHFPATVAAPDAQAFIDQGVAQLHSFYYLEAERSFRQAAKLDPACPIAYWGMAMSNVNNAKRAKGFLKEAQERAKKTTITPRETLYIDALAAFYREQGTDKDRRRGLLEGLESIVQSSPEDVDAKAWLAMVAWQNGQADGINSRQAIDSIIDLALQQEPMHPGAHHYRIHLWDGAKPQRALTSAALFGKSAPGIAHAWHMPGHTYTSLKRYADAAYQQEASARVDHASMLRERTMPFEIHNYAHNNQWLCTSLSNAGRPRDAITVARNLIEQPRDPQKNGPNDGGSAQREGRARIVELLIRYEFWDELISLGENGAIDWTDVPVERKNRHYSLGVAYAAKGDTEKLSQQLDALNALKPADDKDKKDAAEGDKPGEKRSGRRRNQSGPPGIDNAIAELDGYLKLARGETDAAFAEFDKAKDMRPERLARLHLAAGHAEKAEATARNAVNSHPNEFPPMACLVEILQGVGKPKEAQAAFETLAPLLAQADADSPVAARLAALVRSWKTDEGWSAHAATPPVDPLTADRVDVTTLGPLTWTPYPAESLAGVDTEGQAWDLSAHRDRNVLVIFYLGGKCAHCLQQLAEFGKAVEELKALNTDVVAISTDDLEATRAIKHNEDGVKFPMPLIADPTLALFKSYRCHDDFEQTPLHGTFLIDGRGGVRFHRIGADPFLDVEFIKNETRRVGKLMQ
jgi:peroxiredoxin